MNTLFVWLFLLAFVLLVWSLISPRSLAKGWVKGFNRKRFALLLGSASVAFFVLVGITAPPRPTAPVTFSPASTTRSTSSVSQSKVAGESTTQKPAAKSTPKPKITTKTVNETQAIPFESKTVTDPSISKGTTKITTAGANGQKTLTYQVTYTDGKQTDEKLTRETITKQPITQITSVGSKVAITPAPAPAPTPAPAPSCDPNYSGACVPIASDVDCLGGSGNGPAYVQGPVYIIGVDIYRLDNNGNGIGCE